MKPYLHALALVVALAVGLAAAAFSGSAHVPHPLLIPPLLFAGAALPVVLVWRLYRPFRDNLLIIPMVSTVVLAGLFSALVPAYLLGLRGEPETATVTEYVGRGTKGNGHHVRMAREDGSEFPGEFAVPEPYAPGTRLVVLVDPEGWAPAGLADDPRPGGWFPWAAGAAYGVVGGLYVAGILREPQSGPRRRRGPRSRTR